jgi:hypothetical protein
MRGWNPLRGNRRADDDANWGAKANVALIFAPVAAMLALAAFLTALVVDPPTLGWVGFAIASALTFALAVAATLLVPRLRVSAQRPAAAHDLSKRLLVVADAQCDESALCAAIHTRLDRAVDVRLVVPVRVSHLHFLTNDESEEQLAAEQTMSATVALLRHRGIPTTGYVGSDKPLESMTDALGAFPATEVVLATPPADESYWLERDFLTKAQALTSLPVTQVIVPTPERSKPGRGRHNGHIHRQRSEERCR